MTPDFFTCFRAMYHENHYLPPVDLSERALAQHLFETENLQLAENAQKLISNPEVQKILSEPLTYDLDTKVPRNCRVLESHQFKILGSKPNLQNGGKSPFYSVIEHNNLPGWIIKSGATRVPEDRLIMGPQNDRNEVAFFTAEESILRIAMASRISEVAHKSNIDIVVPKKKLVKYANVESPSTPTTTYCVVAEKLDILSYPNTVSRIKAMKEEQQKETAQKICSIVQKVGLVDASFENIRLTRNGKLAFIDTEPAGLMTVKKAGLWNAIFSPKGASVEKCARIGLFTLLHQTSKGPLGTARFNCEQLDCEPGFESFRKEVQSQYDVLLTPKLSKWKIAASAASLGIIALINAIVALVTTIWIRKTLEKLGKIDYSFQLQSFDIMGMRPAEQQRLIEEHQKNRTPTAKRFFALTEGIPYQHQLV